MTGQNPTITSLETQYKVEQFLYKQASALDDRNWETWLNLFSESGKYWMPASNDQKFAEGVPNIFYEDKYLMDMRIRRVEHPYAHSQKPGHRTSHVVSNVIITEINEPTGVIKCESRFHMVEYRLENQRYFGGKYSHTLKTQNNEYLIDLQRVDLANVEGPFDYVMQVWL